MNNAGIQILKYSALPGFIPRIGRLLTSGFGYTSYLIALIYGALRLLPPGHPYLDPGNIGRYGIRHVIAQAANNLVFSWKTADQVVIYFTVLSGLLLLLGQFVMLVIAVIAQQPAFAQSMNDLFFVTSPYNPGEEQDYAFIMLDRIFGMSGIFNSCISKGVNCLDINGNPIGTIFVFPTPFHIALHGMLEFYSRGIFLVGVFIILYFVVVATAETASTGSAFGQRFNRTWAPIRIIAFFALLMPLNLGTNNGGLNAAQLITLWAAKGGSNFATNGWGYFNDTLTDTLLGKEDTLIARPVIPEVKSVAQFMLLVKTCKAAEEAAHGYDIDAFIVREEPAAGSTPLITSTFNSEYLTTMDFDDAVKFSNYGNIIIRFGDSNVTPKEYLNYKGFVFPQCGEIVVPITSVDKDGEPVDSGGASYESGYHAIQRMYYEMVQKLWAETLPGEPPLHSYAQCLLRRTYQPLLQPDCTPVPDSAFAKALNASVENYVSVAIPAAIDEQVNKGDWSIPDKLRNKGWVGAAIWYNRIADMNGKIMTAVQAAPRPSHYPYLMEEIAHQRNMQNANVEPQSAYDPILTAGENIEYPEPIGSIDNPAYEQIAPAMHAAYAFWNTSEFSDSTAVSTTGIALIDLINALFGTSGIFDMAKNTDVNPLAQLSALGKGMMEASIRNVGIGVSGEALKKIFPNYVGEIGGAAASMIKTFGTATMAMSFVMYYVLPSLPFIYFIFAVSGWIKSIFEAIVAVPLWALAHIVRMDGEGLPGPAATNGYFLLLEIFLRPILIVVGLLASITIFSGMVKILNDVFDLVVVNVTGFNTAGAAPGLIDLVRGPIDRFFFTIMYVILCYLSGISCFKLIDSIPDKILRWAGVSVSTFQESAGDPASQVVGKTYKGGLLASNQVKGGALAALG